MNAPGPLLERLGLTLSERTTYLAMLKGAASVAAIRKTTGQKIPTIYHALGRLQERGLVNRTGRSEGASFAVEPPARLRALVDARLGEVERLRGDVEGFVEEMEVSHKPSDGRPHVSFYEGEKAVRTVLMETLYAKSKKIDTIAPIGNFLWSLGKDFTDAYTEERITRKIRKRNIWDRTIEPKRFTKYYAGRDDVRILPAHMKGTFSGTIMLYDDRTLYLSSLEDANALLVVSEGHHRTMTALFEGLWRVSAKHPE